MLTLLLLLFPLVASLVVLASGNKLAAKLALLFALVELGLTGYCLSVLLLSGSELFTVFQEWITDPKISLNLGLDGLSMLMVLLTNFLLPVIILTGFNRVIDNAKAYFSLILMMQFALLGVFMANDGLLYYIFWELALIPIYFIALNWGGPNRVPVTLKFFIYTLAGSLFMLFGFIALYHLNPGKSFNISELYSMVISKENQAWLFWMFFAAFAIKIPIIPFHTWQVDTYKESPTQGTMLLSGIMLKMGTYSLLRWLLPVFPEGAAMWTPLIMGLCIAGIVYASIIAIMQKDLKRLLAYSSLAHVGLISAGIFTLNITGLEGSVVQMLSHGVVVVGLFFAADIIYHRTSTLEIDKLGGIRTAAPQFNTLFLIIVLASVGLPLTNSFIGEFLLLLGVFQYNYIAAGIGGLTIILSAVYMFRMFQRVMLGKTNEVTVNFADLHWNEKVVLWILVIVIIAAGIYPQPILAIAEPALRIILDNAVLN